MFGNSLESSDTTRYGFHLRGKLREICRGLLNNACEMSQYSTVKLRDRPLKEKTFKVLNRQPFLTTPCQQVKHMHDENIRQQLRLPGLMGSRLADQQRLDGIAKLWSIGESCRPLKTPDEFINQRLRVCGCDIFLELKEHRFLKAMRAR